MRPSLVEPNRPTKRPFPYWRRIVLGTLAVIWMVIIAYWGVLMFKTGGKGVIVGGILIMFSPLPIAMLLNPRDAGQDAAKGSHQATLGAAQASALRWAVRQDRLAISLGELQKPVWFSNHGSQLSFAGSEFPCEYASLDVGREEQKIHHLCQSRAREPSARAASALHLISPCSISRSMWWASASISATLLVGFSLGCVLGESLDGLLRTGRNFRCTVMPLIAPLRSGSGTSAVRPAET